MISLQGCHDWDPNFYCDVHDEWLYRDWHVVLDGNVFHLTRGEVHTGNLCCNGSIDSRALKSLVGEEILGRVVKGVEAFAIASQRDGISVGLLLESLRAQSRPVQDDPRQP